MKNIKIYAALAATLALGASANAAVLVPTSVVNSPGSQAETGDAGSSLASLIDGSGLTGGVTDTGGATHSTTLADFWVTTDPGAGGGDYFVDKTAAPLSLDFTLAAASNVGRIIIWGYDPGFGADAIENTATAATISFSTDGTNFGSATNVTFSASGGPQTADFSTFTGATQVRVEFTDNGFDGVGLGGDRVGLGEVRFSTVPEPSSMALLGLGGIALLRRRRK